MRFALCTTTINVPVVLDAYAKDFLAHNRRDVRMYVVSDLKTPAEAEAYCHGIQQTYGIEVDYLNVEQQKAYMAAYPELDAHLPFNSVQRRNIGHLKAYEEGCHTLITIDDDNFPHQADYLGHHGIVGETVEVDVANSPDGWYNVCLTLDERNGRVFFPRGFPVTLRGENRDATFTAGSTKVGVNAGLWLGDPDVDAVTRLAAPIDATRYKRGRNIVLAPGVFCPFNSQNTAVAGPSLPAYFMSPHVGRYDDIWASYLYKHLADHLHVGVTFGSPLVRQDRNVHNLFNDLRLEHMGMQKTEDFMDLLTGITVQGDDFQSTCENLVDTARAKTSVPEFSQFFEGYALWLVSTRRALARGGR